jgi:tetratricopeptide (TPR) repeat protein
LKLLPGVILVALALSGTTVAATRVNSAGSKYFDEADRALRDGQTADSNASVEKGWAAVLAAGPIAPGFLEGVDDASRIFSALGLGLRAEGVYSQAETLTADPEQKLLWLRLQYMHADYFIRHSEYVKAESTLRSSFSAENRTAQKSSLYVAFLQSLAFVREQQGDLDGAEAFYRMTMGYPPPDLPDVVGQHLFFGKQPLPFIGEPRLSMAAFYANHGRTKEAEALYLEQLAQPSLNSEERLGILQQLTGFLSAHVSKTEALAVQEQIVEFRKTQPLTTPALRDLLANERYQLANLEVDVGRANDAKALLESDLRQAELQHGKTSPEYTEALNYLFENRTYARDYDSAEKWAREEVERAEALGASESIGLASALFHLADVRGAQGHIKESEALGKRGIEVNRADFPEPLSTRRFADAEALVRAGKPGEAVRIAREISEGAARRDSRADQFGFHHLAQLMVIDDKSGAAQVASIALSVAERGALPQDLTLARDLTDWANFYRGALGEPDRARDLLTRAQTIVRACCETTSPMMEPVLQERAWLAGATDGQAASIPYLEQLRDLRASIYGVHSRQVEQTTHDLAAAKAKAGQ